MRSKEELKSKKGGKEEASKEALTMNIKGKTQIMKSLQKDKNEQVEKPLDHMMRRRVLFKPDFPNFIKPMTLPSQKKINKTNY
jgi:hypothetical protein